MLWGIGLTEGHDKSSKLIKVLKGRSSNKTIMQPLSAIHHLCDLILYAELLYRLIVSCWEGWVTLTTLDIYRTLFYLVLVLWTMYKNLFVRLPKWRPCLLGLYPEMFCLAKHGLLMQKIYMTRRVTEIKMKGWHILPDVGCIASYAENLIKNVTGCDSLVDVT